jgi:hypothetical protein
MNKDKRKGKRIISTLLQSRTPMFLPVKKLSGNFEQSTSIVVENRLGRITLQDCKLTQVHRNIVDIIFSNYEPIKIYETGDTAYVFPKYEVLKLLGYISKRNGKWLETKFEEMRKASVIFETETSSFQNTSYEGVITKHQVTKIKGKANHPLYGVIFSSAFMAMFNEDVRIHSAKLTPKILCLKHAVTQALVRSCISHRQVNRSIDQIFSDIGVNKSQLNDRVYRRKIKEVRSESEQLKELFGIELRDIGKRKLGVFYNQHDDVWFSKPPKKQDPNSQKAVIELETEDS